MIVWNFPWLSSLSIEMLLLLSQLLLSCHSLENSIFSFYLLYDACLGAGLVALRWCWWHRGKFSDMMCHCHIFQERGQNPVSWSAPCEKGRKGETERWLQPGGCWRGRVWCWRVFLPAGCVRSDPDSAPQFNSTR